MSSFAPRTAYVFAGGGSLGAVEVGMLRALTEHGLLPDLVVGCSAGAINAAYYAGDPSAEGVARLDGLWRGLTRSQVMPMRLRDVLRIILRRDHVVDPTALRRLLQRHLPYQRLEQAPIPVHVVATDMVLGSEVLLSPPGRWSTRCSPVRRSLASSRRCASTTAN